MPTGGDTVGRSRDHRVGKIEASCHQSRSRPATWSKAGQTLPVGSANICDCVEHLLEMRDAQRRVQQFSDAIKAVGLVFSGIR
jgi:hypothetical protein